MDNAVTVTVLIVDSVDDKITQDRHLVLARSEKLRNIKFEYCYAVDMHCEQEAVVEDDLVQRIHQAVLRCRPRYVLLHTGFVFRRDPDVFTRAFARLKSMTPYVTFGLQMRPGMVRDRQAFDETKPVIDLERLIFTQVLGHPVL